MPTLKGIIFILSFAYVLAAASAQVVLQEWVNRYNGQRNTNDAARAIALNGNGDVFVTGYSHEVFDQIGFATIGYSSIGVPLWTNRHFRLSLPPPVFARAIAIVLDEDGNVLVTGTCAKVSTSGYSPRNLDYGTLKYSSAGGLIWSNQYASPYGDRDDDPIAMGVDPLGNVYVTGTSWSNGRSNDIATVKYSSSGVPMWTNRYDATNDDFARAMALDNNGNILVTGGSVGSGTGYDYVTISYDSNGVPVWTNRFGSNGVGYDCAQAIAVNSNGDIFVTGYVTNSFAGYDYATIAYSSTGAPLWTNYYDGPDSGDDLAVNVKVNTNTLAVLVTGYSSSGGNGYDYATIAYSSTGVPLWTNRYNGPGNDDDRAFAMAVDKSGNVWVTGESIGNGSGYDYATIAYSDAGAPLCTNRYNGLANGDDHASGIALDDNGGVYVTGRSLSPGTWEDYATIKYSATPPQLQFQVITNELVLHWPNVKFALQSAPTPTGIFTSIPSAKSPYTNPIVGTQHFFRLISQ